MSISTAEATLDLALLHSDAEKISFLDIASDLAAKNIPLEIVTRMESLWDNTKMIAGELISIGKIIVIKIWEFIKANPNMAIGIALGIAIGALVGLIPFIGTYLAPIAMLVVGFVGGLEGHRMDRIMRGEAASDSYFENLISMAKEFYKLFAEIFLALKDRYFAN